MNVTIGRQELIALCISIEKTGPALNPEFAWMFQKRPFTNGEFWRLTSEAIATATNQQLIDLYSPHSLTLKLL